MSNIFSQPKLMHKVSFNTLYKYVNFFESFFSEDVLGISAFELESKTIESESDDLWHMEIYFLQKPEEMVFTENLNYFATQNNFEIIGDIKFETIEDKDWVAEYQAQLVPINIGRFCISSFDKKNQCPETSIPIILEASRAFGTGEHETTSGCIEAMEHLSDHNFATIYDIGTGTGVLSFAAAKIWPYAKILACDIEEISVEVARFNQKFNYTNIDFYQNSQDDLQTPNKYNKNFDLIISNILANPLIQLSKDIKTLLNKETRVILSGFLDYQMNDVIEAYSNIKLEVEKLIQKNNWVTLTLKVKNN